MSGTSNAPTQPPPPPPPPPNVLPPPPPPPPPEISDREHAPVPPPPPPLTSDGLTADAAAVEGDDRVKTADATTPTASYTAPDTPAKPQRKRRFSPSAQEPPVGPTSKSPHTSSSSHASSSSRTDFSQTSPSPGSNSTKKPLTANEWEKTSFVGDASGDKRVKFLRLMGLGKSTKIEAKPESPEEASREAAKRQQQLSDMERQYEQGRRQRHRFS
ncbi:unnamed protein product [Mortierella alpina]